MTTTDYIHSVERAIRSSENSWAWEATPHIAEDELEISDAAIALSPTWRSRRPAPAGPSRSPTGRP